MYDKYLKVQIFKKNISPLLYWIDYKWIIMQLIYLFDLIFKRTIFIVTG